MSSKRRGGYPYILSNSAGLPGKTKKKRGPGRYIVLFLLAVVAAVAAWHWGSKAVGDIGAFSPFPNKLVALRFQHNGQEVILLPDSQCVLNPRDTLKLLDIQTDGWVSWGAKVASTDMDIRSIKKKALVIRDLFPEDSFENAKNVEIRVLLWNRFIGKVSFLVQLDARDWLQKANAASDADRKIFCLDKALTENPGNVLVKTQLAGLYFENKNYEEAGRLYREINEAGKSKSILERLLTVYQLQNKVDDALGVYLELLGLAPDDTEFFKEFLQYLQKRKAKNDAVKFLEKHQQQIPNSFQSPLLLFMADLSTQTKNWSEAAKTYEKAIKSGVKDPDVLYNLAVTYQQSDDPDKAIQTMERYLQKNPGDIKSWMQLADLYEKKGSAAKARSVYETVLQRSPQNKDALLRLVAILEKSNDKIALQSAYEKLAHIQPKNKTIQYNLAILYYQGKKWDKAAAGFEAIAAMDANDIESRKYLLDVYRKQKDKKKEVAMLHTLAQMDSKSGVYYDALFKSHDEEKDYKGMAAVFKPLCEKQPDSAQAHNYLLYALLKLGDNKGALKELEQLIRLQPKEKKYLRQAASLYESQGNYGEAVKKIDLLIKLDPKNREAQDDYLRLRRLMMGKKKEG